MSDDGQSQVEEKKKEEVLEQDTQNKEEPKEQEQQKKEEEKQDTQNKEEPKEQVQQKKDESKQDEKKKDDKKKKASPEPPKDKEEQRKEYFQEELKRLQKNLKNEKAKIKTPPCKEYTPYIHNPLTPYFTTDTAEKVFNESHAKKSFASRPTAIGLCDPWVDHQMDVDVLDHVEAKPQAKFKDIGLRKADGKHYEGSTRLPKYPAVTVEKPELANSKHLNYGDVPQLRKELKEKTSSKSDNKLKADYKRTKDDFYRMDLDKLNEVHPLNRDHMKNAYFAYLQNTPGSKKAIKECVQDVEDEEEEGEHGEEEEDEENKSEKGEEREDGGAAKSEREEDAQQEESKEQQEEETDGQKEEEEE